MSTQTPKKGQIFLRPPKQSLCPTNHNRGAANIYNGVCKQHRITVAKRAFTKTELPRTQHNNRSTQRRCLYKQSQPPARLGNRAPKHQRGDTTWGHTPGVTGGENFHPEKKKGRLLPDGGQYSRGNKLRGRPNPPHKRCLAPKGL